MGNAVKVHPLAVVLAVATGGLIGGIPGALFAVPVVATLNVMIGYIARGEWRTDPHPTVSDVVPSTRGARRARGTAGS
jgi:predicted PurR-regulated permease PerM